MGIMLSSSIATFWGGDDAHKPFGLRFSSADLPQRERATVLREVFGRGICNMDIAPLTDAPHVEMELRALPDLNIMWGRNSPHRMIVNHVPNRDEDMFMMSIFAMRPGRSSGRTLRELRTTNQLTRPGQ